MSSHSHRAPATSPRPRSRPEREGHAPSTSLRPVARPDSVEQEGFGQPGTTPGMYDSLGMRDDSAEFGALAARPRRGEPSEVILHQTMSTSGESTEQAYAGRIRSGDSTGAHYLVDEEGQTSLTVPTDQVVWHAKGRNSRAIGIETVGMPATVSQRSDMHAQIEALDLSPKLKERLLAMSERDLKRTLRNNGNYIYEDLSGPQKRATWNLLRAIADEYGIDLDAGVESHEHVQAKTVGEGENAEEMVDTMLSWPAKVEELETRLAEARNAGAPDGYLADLEDELAEQLANLAAVDADKTAAENNALEGEQILGEPGAAAAREERRNAFWDAFYDNMERLDALLATPIPGGSGPRVS